MVKSKYVQVFFKPTRAFKLIRQFIITIMLPKWKKTPINNSVRPNIDKLLIKVQ